MDEHRIQLIAKVISRLPLTHYQLLLFRVLYQAGDDWVTRSELAYRIQVREAVIIGIFGGLGNRINKTEGIKPPYDGYGLLMVWETHGEEQRYRMLPEFRTVIDRFPILKNALNLSFNEIIKLYIAGLEVR